MKDTGGQAFPIPGLSGLPNGEFIYGESGMTLRDYFAAKAMQAMLAYPNSTDTAAPQTYANAAYTMADAMLQARK